MRAIKRGAALVAVAALCSTLALADTVLLSAMGGQQVSSQELAGNTYSYSNFDAAVSSNVLIETSFTSCTVSNGDLAIAGQAAAASAAGKYMSSLQFKHLSIHSGRVVLSKYFPYSTSVVFSEVTGTAPTGANLFDMTAFLPQGNVSVMVSDSVVSWVTAGGGNVVALGPQVSTTSAVFVLNVKATNAAAILAAAGTAVVQQSLVAVDYCICSSCSVGAVSLNGLVTVSGRSLLRITHPVMSGTSAPILAGTSLDVSDSSLVLMDAVAQPSATLSTTIAVTKDTTSTVTLRNINVNRIGGTFSSPVLQSVVAGGSDASGSSAFTTPTVLDSSGKSGGQCYPAVCIPGNYQGLNADCSCRCGVLHEYSCAAMYDPLRAFEGICKIPFCLVCSGSSMCTRCRDNYYLSEDKMSCLLKTTSCSVANCARCMLNDDSKCSICNAGYLLTSNYLFYVWQLHHNLQHVHDELLYG